MEVFSTSSDSILKLSRGPASTTSTIFKVGTDSAFIINNQASDVLTIKNGNVGIGTTSPGANLDISGSAHTYLRIGSPSSSYYGSIQHYQGGVRIWETGPDIANSNNYFIYSQTGGRVFQITTAGNVGIGTISPGAKLDVEGTLRANYEHYNCAWYYNSTTSQCNYSYLVGAACPTGKFLVGFKSCLYPDANYYAQAYCCGK